MKEIDKLTEEFWTYVLSNDKRLGILENKEVKRWYIEDLIEEKLNSFLKREQSELQDLFFKVKKEDAERIDLILEGVKSHTARIEKLEEERNQWKN